MGPTKKKSTKKYGPDMFRHRGGEAPSSVIVVCRSRIQDQVAVAVAGLTERFFNHIQKDFLINVWGIILHSRMMCRMMRTYHPIILQARRGIVYSFA